MFSLAEGTVTVQWPVTLSPESYEDLGDWLDILKRKIGRSVKEPGEQTYARLCCSLSTERWKFTMQITAILAVSPKASVTFPARSAAV